MLRAFIPRVSVGAFWRVFVWVRRTFWRVGRGGRFWKKGVTLQSYAPVDVIDFISFIFVKA